MSKKKYRYFKHRKHRTVSEIYRVCKDDTIFDWINLSEEHKWMSTTYAWEDFYGDRWHEEITEQEAFIELL